MKYLLKRANYFKRLNCNSVSVYIIILLFTACAKDSDKLVKETMAIKQFNIEAYSDDDLGINTKLKEQVILIEGIIKDINTLNNRSTVILKGKNSERFVICDMQKSENLALLNIGDVLTVKGILKGTLKDVILLNCIISNT